MRNRIWHLAYSRWYDHWEAGHPKRSKMWGRISDRLIKVLWPIQLR